MTDFLSFCHQYEALFLPILAFETLVSFLSLIICFYYMRRADKWAEIEFNYDKDFNDRMLARKARRKTPKIEDKVNANPTNTLSA